MVPKKIGRYPIEDELGRGAMGVVYKGHDSRLGRTVAIKTIRKAAFANDELKMALERFKREAQAAGQLSHPNIVMVYDFGVDRQAAYIVMEFAEGKSLQEVLKSGKAMTMSVISNIILQLLCGLSYAHEHGVIHRDIKLGNVMLARGGKVKLMDFGIARVESSTMTTAGTFLGTPSYMAPELFDGQEADARSDLFAVAVVAYQLLCGRKPFTGPNMTAIMRKVMDVEPTPPREIISTLPAEMDELIDKALHKDPDQRFQNATEFAAAWKEASQKVSGNLIPLAELTDQQQTRAEKVAAPQKGGSGKILTMMILAALVMLVSLFATGKVHDLPLPKGPVIWLQSHPPLSWISPPLAVKELAPRRSKRVVHKAEPAKPEG